MLPMLMPAAAASSCAAVLLLLKLAAIPLNLRMHTQQAKYSALSG
jgi:hypothetical protein